MSCFKTNCPYCQGIHLEDEACPGKYDPTGGETIGWRATADTPDGVEAYGIFLDRTPVGWRTRIVTFPKTLWLLPGQAVTLKFFAGRAEHAVGLALEFVRFHFRSKPYPLKNAQFHDSLIADHFTDFRLSPPRHKNQERRKAAFFDIRFGSNRPSISGTTRDLSPHGLFIVTPQKFDYGRSLQLRLGLDKGPLKLEGQVRWVRESILPGIGVQLEAPPMEYRQAVRDLPTSH
jgi:hypothetical protein